MTDNISNSNNRSSHSKKRRRFLLWQSVSLWVTCCDGKRGREGCDQPPRPPPAGQQECQVPPLGPQVVLQVESQDSRQTQLRQEKCPCLQVELQVSPRVRGRIQSSRRGEESAARNARVKGYQVQLLKVDKGKVPRRTVS